jgi:hypothetical protein
MDAEMRPSEVSSPAAGVLMTSLSKKLSFSNCQEVMPPSTARGENVDVFLRIKPCKPGVDPTIAYDGDDSVVARAPAQSQMAKNRRGSMVPSDTDSKYSFTSVFDQDAGQKEVFERTTRPLIDKLLEGEHGLLFAYGITNAGKTHTISGDAENQGILPRTLRAVFEEVRQRSAAAAAQEEEEEEEEAGDEQEQQQLQPPLEVSVSYLEIHNERVFDLLATPSRHGRTALKVKDNNGRIIVQDLSTPVISSAEEGLEKVAFGGSNRQVAETHCNTDSSRSHCVFSIRLTQRNADPGAEPKVSQLWIVDLAGCERTRRSGASGARLKEASAINTSLMHLMMCIKTLRWNQNNAGKPKRMVPVRMTKLTQLFQEALVGRAGAGHGKTVMIVNASADPQDFDETAGTLKYGALARSVLAAAVPQGGAGAVNRGEHLMSMAAKYDANGRRIPGGAALVPPAAARPHARSRLGPGSVSKPAWGANASVKKPRSRPQPQLAGFDGDEVDDDDEEEEEDDDDDDNDDEGELERHDIVMLQQENEMYRQSLLAAEEREQEVREELAMEMLETIKSIRKQEASKYEEQLRQRSSEMAQQQQAEHAANPLEADIEKLTDEIDTCEEQMKIDRKKHAEELQQLTEAKDAELGKLRSQLAEAQASCGQQSEATTIAEEAVAEIEKLQSQLGEEKARSVQLDAEKQQLQVDHDEECQGIRDEYEQRLTDTRAAVKRKRPVVRKTKGSSASGASTVVTIAEDEKVTEEGAAAQPAAGPKRRRRTRSSLASATAPSESGETAEPAEPPKPSQRRRTRSSLATDQADVPALAPEAEAEAEDEDEDEGYASWIGKKVLGAVGLGRVPLSPNVRDSRAAAAPACRATTNVSLAAVLSLPQQAVVVEQVAAKVEPTPPARRTRYSMRNRK